MHCRELRPVVAVTTQKAVPSSEFLESEGNLEREKEVEDTTLDLWQLFTDGLQERDASSSTQTATSDSKHAVVEEHSLDEKLFLVVTDAEGDTLAQVTKSKNDIIGSQPRGNHNVFTHYPKDPKWEVCEDTKTTRAKCRGQPKKLMDGIATTFGDLSTADYKILNVENESRCGHKNALIVQDDLTSCIQTYLMKTT